MLLVAIECECVSIYFFLDIDKSNEKGNERDAERKEGKKKKELVRYIV